MIQLRQSPASVGTGFMEPWTLTASHQITDRADLAHTTEVVLLLVCIHVCTKKPSKRTIIL